MAERRGFTFRSVRGDEASPPRAAQPQGGPDFRPLGGDPTAIRLISGMDGVVSSVAAAAQELRDAAKEMRVLNQRQLQMYGQGFSQEGTATGGITQRDIVEAFEDAIQEQTSVLVASLPAVMRGEAPPPVAFDGGVPQAPSGGRPRYADDPTNPYQYPPGEEPPAVPNAPSGGRRVAPPSRGETTRTDQLRDGEEEAQPTALSNWEEVQRRRDYFKPSAGAPGKHGISLGNLRQDLGTRVAERVGNWNWGEQLAQDPLGNWRHEGGEDGADFGGLASQAAIQAFLRREKVAGAVRGAATTVAQGGTLRQAGVNMLPAGAAKFLGTAGAAAYAIDKVGDFAEQQRAANAEWQRMQGGSNAAAFGERARSSMFGWSQFGTMGEQDAQRLYQGVAATGMDRGDRATAQNFAVQNYKQFGMTIEQSLEVVNTAAKTGQENLRGFSDALEGVTEAAKEAGVNTEVARQRFVDTWQSFSETLSGPAAVTTAQAFTQAQMGMGRRYEDLDFSGVGSEEQMRMMGARRGMTYNEVLAQSMAPGGQVALTEMWTEDARWNAQQQLGDRGMGVIAEMWENRSGQGLNGGFTDAERQAMSQRLLEEVPGMDLPTLIRATEQMTGMTGLDVNDALGYIAGLQTGEFDPVAEAEAEIERGRTRDIDVETQVAYGAGGATVPAVSEDFVDLAGRVQEKRSGWRWGDRDARKMGRAFMEDVRETGRAGGISEAIATGGKGIRGDVEKVEVQTAAGPRIVNLSEAMEHFRDQIDAGTAVVVEGGKAGVTVSEAVGMVGDEALGVTSATNEELADIGKSAEEAAEERRGEGGGVVTISPTPELQRFFRFSGEGNVDVSPSAGWRPPNPHVTPRGRPSGTPGP